MTTTAIAKALKPSPPKRSGLWRGLSLDWLGLVPFFGFVALFLIFPALSIVVRSFSDGGGNFTLSNLRSLTNPVITLAYRNTL